MHEPAEETARQFGMVIGEGAWNGGGRGRRGRGNVVVVGVEVGAEAEAEAGIGTVGAGGLFGIIVMFSEIGNREEEVGVVASMEGTTVGDVTVLVGVTVTVAVGVSVGVVVVVGVGLVVTGAETGSGAELAKAEEFMSELRVATVVTGAGIEVGSGAGLVAAVLTCNGDKEFRLVYFFPTVLALLFVLSPLLATFVIELLLFVDVFCPILVLLIIEFPFT